MLNLDITEYRVTCEGAPYQVEGRVSDGRYFYFRSRHRTIRLGLGETPGLAANASFGAGCVALELRGYEDDRHLVSSLDPGHARVLVEILLDIVVHAEEWRHRVATGDTLHARLLGRSTPSQPADIVQSPPSP